MRAKDGRFWLMAIITRRNLLAAGASLAVASHPVFGVKASNDARKLAGFDGVRSATSAAVESGDIPGALSVVWKDGRIRFAQLSGVRNVESHAPVEPSTLFAIASMSKPVTVAVALMLVDQGIFKLDDPITRWAPEFANMRVLRRADGPLHDTYPAPRAITIEDLMTHRSGLSYSFLAQGPLAGALFAKFGMGIESKLSPDEWLQNLAALPLAYAPGERYNYGHSIDVLGFVVGRAAGTALRQVMHERLFDPLRMVDTDFWIPPAKRARAASIYFSPGPGDFKPAAVSGFFGDSPPTYTSGGQGLVSTAPDYLKFAQLLLGGGVVGGKRLLRPGTVKRMTEDHLSDAQRGLPFMNGVPWGGLGFGLGMPVVVKAGSAWGGAGVGSFGWGGAFGGWWQADPTRNAVLLWLQSCLPAPPVPGKPLSPRVPGAMGVAEFQGRANAALDG
jgi:CubicO group peptidase (beta-lactamase class C family)